MNCGCAGGGPGRQSLLVLVLCAVLSHGAAADLVGDAPIRAAVAGMSDEALIEANPVLKRLKRQRPELLVQALERLRTPSQRPSHRRSLANGVPAPATSDENAILAENPDFAVLHRESPEAALDLLRLIREAARTN